LFLLPSGTNPLPKEGSLPGHTPPRLLPLSCQPRGCGGGIGRSPQAHPKGGTHSTLLRRAREAFRPRSKAKPQMGQHTTRSSNAKFLLILPGEKHLLDELEAGSAKTHLPRLWKPSLQTPFNSGKNIIQPQPPRPHLSTSLHLSGPEQPKSFETKKSYSLRKQEAELGEQVAPEILDVAVLPCEPLP
jgi:hypothetical protein